MKSIKKTTDMEWKNDKILHYKKAFNWSHKGMILGLWSNLILAISGNVHWWLVFPPLSGCIAILLIGAGKEITYDGWMGKGTREWADMKANIIGAVDGLLFWKKSRFN